MYDIADHTLSEHYDATRAGLQIPDPKIFEEHFSMEMLKNFQAQCEKDLSNDGALAQTNFHSTSHMDSKQLENLAKKRKYPVAMASKLWFKQALVQASLSS